MLVPMEYFFVFDRDLPPNVGISAFGAEHLCWLCIAVLLTAALCRRLRRAPPRAARRTQCVVCALILLTELCRELCLLSAGVWGIYTLPLHLCSLSVFVTLWHCLKPTPLAGELLYCLGMPGAACALLFPEWLRYPAFNLLSISTFLGHILLVAYPAMLVARGSIAPDKKRLPKCFACLACTAAVLYGFNRLTGANYFFLRVPAPGSPLEWFEARLGNPGYIAGYLPMITAVWLLLYLPHRVPPLRASSYSGDL